MKAGIVILMKIFVWSMILLIYVLAASCNLPMVEKTPQMVIPIILTETISTKSVTPKPEKTSETLSGTVSIWHSFDESQLPALVQIITDFQVDHPDVLFDVLYIPVQDIKTRFEQEVNEGRGPTILLGPAEWGPSLLDAGHIVNVSDVISNALANSLNQPALSSARYKNKFTGIPYAIQGVVLFRNKEIITIDPTTFEELTTLAQASTQGEIIGTILDRSFLLSGGHLLGLGGQFSDKAGNPAFNNQKGQDWIQLLKDFELAGPTDSNSDQDLQAFKEGRVGWIIDGTWNTPTLIESIGVENLTIDTWPAYSEGALSGFVFSDQLFISSSAKNDHLAASQEFIKHFLSPQSQSLLAKIGLIPAVTDVPILNIGSSELIAQSIKALAGGSAYPILLNFNDYRINLEIALKSIFEENIPAETALQIAEESIQNSLKQTQIPASPTP